MKNFTCLVVFTERSTSFSFISYAFVREVKVKDCCEVGGVLGFGVCLREGSRRKTFVSGCLEKMGGFCLYFRFGINFGKMNLFYVLLGILTRLKGWP
jgi:hypothetical protein